MTAEVVDLIENQLREQWSPEQVSGWLNETHGMSLSHERIYLHIWDDKWAGGDLYTHCAGRARSTRSAVMVKPHEARIKNRVGIEHRPQHR